MQRMTTNEDMILKDEAYVIVGGAMEVHSTLSSGFPEAIYADALALELAPRGIPFGQEASLGIRDKGRSLNDLKATGHSLALLFHFGAPKLDEIRLVMS